MVFVSIFIILYMIVGVNLYWEGDYYFLGNNFSNNLYRLYDVSSVFIIFLFLFFLFFYYFFKKGSFPIYRKDYELKYKYVLFFTLLIMSYSILSINGIVIPLLNNFFGLFFNAGITIIAYAVISKMKGAYFLLLIFTTLIIYLGFRYRLVFLFLPIIISFFIFQNINILKLFKYSLVTFVSIFIVAVVGVSRKYSSGLQLDTLEGLSLKDIIVGGIFNDTSTVLTSGAVIQKLDDTDGFIYFKQIWYILNYFIPNQLYPEKEYSPIYEKISLATSQQNNESGAAVLGFVEYYHTAGYFGVVLFAFFFGLFFARSFKKMIGSNSIYEHYVYFVLITWFINSLSRGYFPQNMQDLISIMIGFYLIKKFSNSFNNGEKIEIHDKCI